MFKTILNFINKTRNIDIKTEQYMYFAGILLFIAVILISFFYIVFLQEEEVFVDETIDYFKGGSITDSSKEVNKQELYHEQNRKDKEAILKETQAQKLLVQKQTKTIYEQEKKISKLDNRLNQFYTHIKPIKNNPVSGETGDGQTFITPSQDIQLKANIEKIEIPLSNNSLRKRQIHSKTIENYIPASAYARAVILSTADASTSLTAGSDPRPVMLRIVDCGSLGRNFKSDLKGCRVMGSAYGDEASSRVHIRLERLTCIERKTGEIIETEIAGYVQGEDGAYGVRGEIVDRAGKQIAYASLIGVLNSATSFFGSLQQRSAYPISPFGQTNALSKKEMLGTAVAQGANNGLDKMINYLIQKAEKISPFVEMQAGRVVTIVFNNGTKLGDTTVRNAIKETRDRSRREEIKKINVTGDNHNWLPKINDGD